MGKTRPGSGRRGIPPPVKWVSPVLSNPEDYKPCTSHARHAIRQHITPRARVERAEGRTSVGRIGEDGSAGAGRHIAGTFPMVPDPDDPSHNHLPSFEQWLQIFRNSIPAFR